MQRTELTAAIVLGLLLLASSALVGVETVLPGRSPLAGLGWPVLPIHQAVQSLFAALVAAAMAAVAVRDDGPLPELVLILSGVLAISALVLAAIVLVPDAVAAALAPAGRDLPGPAVLAPWRAVSASLSLAVIVMAAGCLVGARPGYGWLGFFVQFATAAIGTLHVVEIVAGGPGASGFLVLIPLLTLLALLAAQLVDEDVPAAPYLFAMALFGLIVTVRAGVGLVGTEVAAMDWLGFLAFVAPVFGLFAAMNRASPGQPSAWIWGHALGLVALALPCMGPMTGVPDATPAASLWGFAFYGWVLVGLTAAARRSVLRSIARGSE